MIYSFLLFNCYANYYGAVAVLVQGTTWLVYNICDIEK